MKQITWDDFDSVVFDLDGTLLNRQRVVSQKTKETLQLLQRRGKKIFIATGRPWYFAKSELKIVNSSQIVSCNGALVFDTRTNETLLIQPIEVETAKQIFHFLLRHKATFVIYSQRGMFAFSIDAENSEWINWLHSQNASSLIEERFNIEVSKNYESDFDFYTNAVLEFIVVLNETPQASVAKIWEYLRELNLVYPVQSQTQILDIMPQNVSKGSGLEELVERKLLNLQRTIVFGDQYNDVSMFEKAAFSVAMGNARDYVKSQATFVTLSNEFEGIHHFFNFMISETKPETQNFQKFPSRAEESVANISKESQIHQEEINQFLEKIDQEEALSAVQSLKNASEFIVEKDQTKKDVDYLEKEHDTQSKEENFEDSFQSFNLDFERSEENIEQEADEQEIIEQFEEEEYEIEEFEEEEEAQPLEIASEEAQVDSSFSFRLNNLETESDEEVDIEEEEEGDLLNEQEVQKFEQLLEEKTKKSTSCSLNSAVFEQEKEDASKEDLASLLFRLHKRAAREIGVSATRSIQKTLDLIIEHLQEENCCKKRLKILVQELEDFFDEFEFSFQNSNTEEFMVIVDKFEQIYDQISHLISLEKKQKWEKLLEDIELSYNETTNQKIDDSLSLQNLEQKLESFQRLLLIQSERINSLVQQLEGIKMAKEFFRKYHLGELTSEDYKKLEQSLFKTSKFETEKE